MSKKDRLLYEILRTIIVMLAGTVINQDGYSKLRDKLDDFKMESEIQDDY